jgi:putative aminophosphonate oxidoreductase
MERSFWLQQALERDPGAPVEPLRGAHRADVCIVGGGYAGLWTALEIKRLEPACDVVVVESDICGGGASGRNGGFVLSWWAKLEKLVKRCGEEEGLRIARASADAVDEIAAFCSDHGIECDFRQAGWIWAATAPAQIGSWQPVLDALAARGIEGVYEPLDPAAMHARIDQATHLCGVFEPGCATVQPALLARGLRRVALEQDVRIHEHSPMVRLDRDRPATVRTPEGVVSADHVVIATNAWAAAMRELSRALAVISSDIVATAPAPERLEQIGWTRGESISDSRQMVHYYQATPEGRLMFGKGGGSLAFRGRIGAGFDHDARRAAGVAGFARSTVPAFADVEITHAWSGPVERSYDGLPFFGPLGGASHISFGVGFSGNGVGPTRVAGKILAELALGRDGAWSGCGLVGPPVLHFPPEPVRYLGGRAVRAAVARVDRADDLGRKADWVSRRLAAFAPAGFQQPKH